MATSPAASDASHESDDGQNATNSKGQHAVKDKECQYCHQKFTSSSLGRHLDQYISKKKPDGIHNVEEIKKIRAGITRRTARGGKRNESTDHTESHDQSGPTSPHSSANIATPAFAENLSKAPGSVNDVRFNRMGWQATGVITDPLPQNTSVNSIPSPLTTAAHNSNNVAGAKRSFSTYAADLPMSSDTANNETARALELSLREVLDAVSSASKRATPLPQAFPFDLSAQTFPSLCLLLLPAPPTIFQPSPFPTSGTVPLKPPGPEQLQALRAKIRATLDQWKWDALAHIQRHSSQSGQTNVGEEAERLSQTANRQTEEALRHLETSFQWFMSISPEQQYSLWSVELLRAYKSEQEKLKEANDKITRISQEALQLQQQIDYLSRCQWPREMALWPPERNTFSSAVEKELQKVDPALSSSLAVVNSYGMPLMTHTLGGTGDDKWDFDKIVNKWKRHVREDKARRGGSGNMPPPLTENHGGDSGTPTSATLRKSTSDVSGLHNGHAHNSTSASDSPNVRNGVYNLGLNINDRMTTFANASSNTATNTGTNGNGSTHRQFAGTPSSASGPGASHAHTPVTNNVQIISDIHDHMSRFAPWLREKELAEEAERMREDD